MTVYSLAYVSTSCLDDLVLDPRVEIEKILRVSQVRNSASRVTGALMFNERMFTQVLEGAKSDVRDIFGSIERDARHKNVAILTVGFVPHRSFASWTMSYAGTSEAAKEYYRDYIADRGSWAAMSREKICELMLNMIALDEPTLPLRTRKPSAQ